MSQYESSVKNIPFPQARVYAKLEDLNNLETLKDKLPEMSEEEQLRLLATDGMLVKRPLVIGDDFVLVGFKEVDWCKHLLAK